MTDFEKVSQWVLENYDVEVDLGQMTCFTGHETKFIFIHHNFNLEKNGLFALLHEVGHAMQESYEENQFGANRYKKVCDLDHPKKFKMLQFMNEVNAWDNGLALAKELDIQIDMKAWTKAKEEALMTYYV